MSRLVFHGPLHSRLGRGAWVALLSGVVVLLGDGLQDSSSPIVFNVETEHVREKHLTRELRIFGSLDAFREVEVSAKVQGQIVRMPVEQGDWVIKDQLLFELDSRSDQIALDRAEAELSKAHYDLKKYQAGSRPEEIEEARRRFSAAEAVNAAAKDDWERVRELARQGIAAASQLVQTRSNYDVAQAQLSQAKARLKLVESGFRNEDVQMAQAEFKVRKAQVAEIERRIADHAVRAPFAGVISRKMKDMGEWTNSGTTALVILVLDPIRLRVEVPQSYLASLKPGQTASVTIPGIEGRIFHAKVSRIIPQARVGSRNFPVLMELPNPNHQLSAGMYAKVELTIDEGKQVLTVSRQALQYRENGLVVYRVDAWDPGNAEASALGPDPAGQDSVAVEVEVDVTREMQFEVAIHPKAPGALWDGCEVVVVGATRLHDRAPLRRLNGPQGPAGTN